MLNIMIISFSFYFLNSFVLNNSFVTKFYHKFKEIM